MEQRKIVVKQTCIEILDYDLGSNIQLEKMFSIYDPLYHKSHFKGLIYDEPNRILKLPRGIDIPVIESLIHANACLDTHYDKYATTNPIMITALPRDDVQKKALRFTLGKGEYEFTNVKSQLSVNLDTGKGKTYITVASLAYWGIRNIIITYSIDWLNQWRDKFVEYTDTEPNEICFINGSYNIKSLLSRDVSKYKSFLISHGTLKSYGDTNGWEAVGELFKYLKIGVKVYDESHLNFDNMCYIDSYTNTYKTLYLTATPTRSNDDENRIFKMSYRTVPSIDLFDKKNDPHTKYIGFRYNSMPTAIEQSNCMNMYGFDRNKYVSYVIARTNFYCALHLLMNIISNTKGKVLVYIATNHAISTIYEWLVRFYPMYTNQIGIYTSLIPDEDKDDQIMNHKIILSTTKSCGAAKDIKGLKLTIVLAEPFKSAVLAKQTFGRTRDDDTVYIEVVDDGFEPMRRYYNKKLPVFEKYATGCSEIRFKKNEIIDKAHEVIDKNSELIYPVRWYNDDGPIPISPIIKYDGMD